MKPVTNGRITKEPPLTEGDRKSMAAQRAKHVHPMSKTNQFKKILKIIEDSERGVTQAEIVDSLKIPKRDVSEKFIALVSLDHIIVDGNTGGPNGNCKIYKLCPALKKPNSTSSK